MEWLKYLSLCRPTISEFESNSEGKISIEFIARMCETFFCSVPDCKSSAMGKEGFAAFESDKIPPVYLQCGHLCCRPCLLSWMANEVQIDIRCKTCNTETKYEEITKLDIAYLVKIATTDLARRGLPCSLCVMSSPPFLAPNTIVSAENRLDNCEVNAESVEDAIPDEPAPFALICKFCDGAQYLVTPDCELQSFSDVISKHVKVDLKLDEVRITSLNITRRAHWHLEMGSHEFIDRIKKMRTCSKCNKIYGDITISRVFKATMQQDSATCDEPVLKFEQINGKCERCNWEQVRGADQNAYFIRESNARAIANTSKENKAEGLNEDNAKE